jgi:MscS family membrane protein
MEFPMMCADLLLLRRRKRQFLRSFVLAVAFLTSSVSWSLPAASATETKEEAPKDTLGRETPRGTVLGFLTADRRGNAQIAALYLNTPLRGENAEALAHQLAVVMDRGLPARITTLSDKPEGSVPDQFSPDEDLVGTVSTAEGNLDILVERVDRGKAGQVWLFSQKTLKSIPDAFKEFNTPPVESYLPKFLVDTRVATIPLFQLVAFFVGLPFLYFLTGVLRRILSPVAGALMRRVRRDNNLQNPQVLHPPVRLLLVALAIRWLLSKVSLSLLARQYWSIVALVLVILGCTWLLIRANSIAERFTLTRLQNRASGSAAVLRLVRRMVDGLILFVALLFTLHHFGVNPSAALTGLGVGGIAVALAAQKTLENVVGGVSIIADHAVHVGDTLKLGETVGTIESVGLRSTRIRTTDRTMVTIPNGQIANMSLETLSARDSFWFHPLVGLRYETTPDQIRAIVDGIGNLLREQPNVDLNSVRVILLRLGASSLDVDVSAYVLARDWNQFLETQQGLLLRIMEIVQQAGTGIAFPSQTMYLATDPSDKGARGTEAPAVERRRATKIG